MDLIKHKEGSYRFLLISVIPKTDKNWYGIYRTLRYGNYFTPDGYKAILIQKENHLLELCRYIVLNPIRAKIAERPDDWKWSSYEATCGIKKSPEFLKVDWVLGQFGDERKTAQKRYKGFVIEGIKKESPWGNVQGQILLGEEGFIEKFKELLVDKEKIKEIPRQQRYLGRASLTEVFKKTELSDKRTRNFNIQLAHLKFGYTLKEIADHLRIHYTTVSKALKEVGEADIYVNNICRRY